MIPQKVFLLLLVILLISLFPLSIIAYNHIEEDTFITLRYAENFVNGKGLVYNEGEHVEGYSNFLWCILLAGAKYLGFNLINSAKILSLIFYAFLIAVSPFFIANIKDKRIPLWALFPPLLLLMNPMLHYQADRGLEAISYAFFIFLSVLLYIKRKYLLASSSLLCVALTRPEGFAYFGIVTFIFIIEEQLYNIKKIKLSTLIDFLKLVLLFTFFFGIYILWRHHYYGWYLPNTVYVKVSKYNFIQNPSIVDLWQFIVSFSFIPLIALSAIWLIKLKGYTQKREIIILFLTIATIIGYTLAIGKVQASAFRHYIPAIPLIITLLTKLLSEMSKRVAIKYKFVPIELGILLFFLNVYTVNNLDAKPTRFHARICQFIEYRDFNERLNWFFDPNDVYFFAEVGRWTRDNIPHNLLLACDQMGQFGYYAPNKIIDLIGLMDVQIAHSRWFDVQYILRRNPDYVLLFGIYGKAYIYPLAKMQEDQTFKDRYALLYILRANYDFFEPEFLVYGNKKTLSPDILKQQYSPRIIKVGPSTQEFNKKWRIFEGM